MNALHQARSAYRSQGHFTRTDRDTEYDAFVRITARLRAAVGRQAGPADLANAIHDNRRMWLLLAGNVADTDNALPQALRARIFYLAEFTSLHSTKVLAGTATAEALIDINTAVMQGLRGAA